MVIHHRPALVWSRTREAAIRPNTPSRMPLNRYGDVDSTVAVYLEPHLLYKGIISSLYLNKCGVATTLPNSS